MVHLAIKGHATRGKEVIEILGMLGGSNAFGHIGDNTRAIYYIDEIYKNFIICSVTKKVCECITFTLEEFLEKFPYKVGDKVKNARINDFIGRIKNVRWDDNEKQIIYVVEWDDITKSTLPHFARDLQPYKEGTMGEELMPRIDFNKYCKDKYLLDLGNYDIKEEDGKTYAVRRKTQYPKTYKECHELMVQWKEYDCNPNPELILCEAQIHDFCKLIVARNIYWKIAGDEMGLGKPWKPNYDSGVNKYDIICINGVIQKSNPTTNWERHLNKVLDFPTEEMRDAFYENFKDLIEQCKELL